MLAFKDVNLVPMIEKGVIDNQTVLIDEAKITKIGPANEVVIPEEAKIIEGKGAYLMPGLADMHVHILRDKWPVSQLKLYLANGVTTIRSLGTTADEKDHKTVISWSSQIKEGRRIGPTICATCPPITGSETNSWKLVSRYDEEGYDCVKLFSPLSKTDFIKAVKTAKEMNIFTVGHIPTAVGLEGVLSEGMNEIAHIKELALELIDFDRNKKFRENETLPFVAKAFLEQYDFNKLNDAEFQKNIRRKVSAIVDGLRFKNIFVHTTLFIFEDIDIRIFEGNDKFLKRPENKYLPEKAFRELSQGNDPLIGYIKEFKEFWHFLFEVQEIFLTELNNALVPLILGTDAGIGILGIVPGFCLHDELRVLTESGFTPYQAIATGTVNASKAVAAMSGRDDFGTIEVGKRADFILVNKNPLEDVGNIKDNCGVMAAGRWYSKSELQEMIALND
ncbi:MAG: amidohydrolase family protein [Desulfobacterales bacterium]|jgi:hypothetical protein